MTDNQPDTEKPGPSAALRAASARAAETLDAPVGLHAKLAAITGALEPVRKDAVHSQQHFAYVTEAAVLAAVRAELAARSVQAYPSFHIEDVREVGQPTSSGMPQLLVTVAGTLTFACGDSGETVDVLMVGQAIDAAGNGATKAMTGAFKTALLKTFLLPTAEDTPGNSPAGTPPASRTPTTPTRGAGGNPSTIDVKFGEHRGKTLGELDDEQLAAVGAAATGQFMRDKVAAEQAKRAAGAQS